MNSPLHVQGEFPKARLEYVSSISWPRSGHHLLVRLLQAYFGSAFVYCEHHAGHPTDEKLGECCRSVPCVKAGHVTMTKNHDFDLKVPQIPGLRYLVQTRAFAPSTVSNFELAVRADLIPDNAASFRHFVSAKFTEYSGFINKWVHSDFVCSHKVLQLPYEELQADPILALTKAIRHIAPEHLPDQARMAAVIRSVDGERIEKHKVDKLRGVGVHKPRSVQDFRYFDPTLFALIEKLSLTRETVTARFKALLNRTPSESNMLNLQCFDNLTTLDDFIKNSDEYKKASTKR
jgi:hypothetical protein